MQASNPYYFDTPDQFGAVIHPFRCTQAGVGQVLEFLFKGVMLPLIISSLLLIPLILLSGVLPEAWRGNVIALVMLAGALSAVFVLRSVRSESVFDKASRQFRIQHTILGRALRGHAWDASLFEGISVASRLGYRGEACFIRLHVKVEGFLVDHFMPADHVRRVRVAARWLAHYSGLEELPDSSAMSQDVLNDLRGNAWLVQRIQRKTSSSEPAAAPPGPAPDPASLKALLETAPPQPGILSNVFVYVFALAGVLVAGFFFHQEWLLQRDFAVIAKGRVAGETYTVLSEFTRLRKEHNHHSKAPVRRHYIKQRMVRLESETGEQVVHPWSPGLSAGMRVQGYWIEDRLRLPDYPPESANLPAGFFALLFPAAVVYRKMRDRRRRGQR